MLLRKIYWPYYMVFHWNLILSHSVINKNLIFSISQNFPIQWIWSMAGFEVQTIYTRRLCWQNLWVFYFNPNFHSRTLWGHVWREGTWRWGVGDVDCQLIPYSDGSSVKTTDVGGGVLSLYAHCEDICGDVFERLWLKMERACGWVIPWSCRR